MTPVSQLPGGIYCHLFVLNLTDADLQLEQAILLMLSFRIDRRRSIATPIGHLPDALPAFWVSSTPLGHACPKAVSSQLDDSDGKDNDDLSFRQRHLFSGSELYRHSMDLVSHLLGVYRSTVNLFGGLGANHFLLASDQATAKALGHWCVPVSADAALHLEGNLALLLYREFCSSPSADCDASSKGFTSPEDSGFIGSFGDYEELTFGQIIQEEGQAAEEEDDSGETRPCGNRVSREDEWQVLFDLEEQELRMCRPASLDPSRESGSRLLVNREFTVNERSFGSSNSPASTLSSPALCASSPQSALGLDASSDLPFLRQHCRRHHPSHYHSVSGAARLDLTQDSAATACPLDSTPGLADAVARLVGFYHGGCLTCSYLSRRHQRPAHIKTSCASSEHSDWLKHCLLTYYLPAICNWVPEAVSPASLPADINGLIGRLLHVCQQVADGFIEDSYLGSLLLQQTTEAGSLDCRPRVLASDLSEVAADAELCLSLFLHAEHTSVRFPEFAKSALLCTWSSTFLQDIDQTSVSSEACERTSPFCTFDSKLYHSLLVCHVRAAEKVWVTSSGMAGCLAQKIGLEPAELDELDDGQSVRQMGFEGRLNSDFPLLRPAIWSYIGLNTSIGCHHHGYRPVLIFLTRTPGLQSPFALAILISLAPGSFNEVIIARLASAISFLEPGPARLDRLTGRPRVLCSSLCPNKVSSTINPTAVPECSDATNLKSKHHPSETDEALTLASDTSCPSDDDFSCTTSSAWLADEETTSLHLYTQPSPDDTNSSQTDNFTSTKNAEDEYLLTDNPFSLGKGSQLDQLVSGLQTAISPLMEELILAQLAGS